MPENSNTSSISALTKDVNELTVTVAEMATMQKIQTENQSDHEKRIRTLEKVVFLGAGALYLMEKIYPLFTEIMSKKV